MFTNILKNFLKTSAVIAAGTSMLLATTNIALAQPGGGGATCSIDTVPSPPEITAGGTVDFSGNINGGQKTFSWTFEGGVPLNSTAQDVTVTYPNPSVPGTFTATLNGTSTKGACPEVSVEVTVNPAGQCVRNAPTISLGADQFIDPDGSAVYALSVTNNALLKSSVALRATRAVTAPAPASSETGLGENTSWSAGGPETRRTSSSQTSELTPG